MSADRKINWRTVAIVGTIGALSFVGIRLANRHGAGPQPEGILPNITPAPETSGTPNGFTGITNNNIVTQENISGFIVNPHNGDRFKRVIDASVPYDQPGNVCAKITTHGETFISLEDALQSVTGLNKFDIYVYNYQPQPLTIDRSLGQQIPSNWIYFEDGAWACAIK